MTQPCSDSTDPVHETSRRRRGIIFVVVGVIVVALVVAGGIALHTHGVGRPSRSLAPLALSSQMNPTTPSSFGSPSPSASPSPLASPSEKNSRPTAATTCPTQSPATGKRQTIVFLDPGHGSNETPTAATSGGSQGIDSGENSSGGNEDADVFAVAVQAKGMLEKAGYGVVLSRQGQPDPDHLTLWQKGLAAEKAAHGKPADIGVSIHTDTKAGVGAGQIYYDNLGGYRTNNTNSLTRTFTNAKTARLSKQYADNFLVVRQNLQHAPITMTPGHNFPASRALGSHGTIPIIMLTAQNVPWVYNEMGRTTTAGLSPSDRTIYATAIAEGVEKSLPPTMPDKSSAPAGGQTPPAGCGS